MNQTALFDGLLNYLYLVILVTFHEFGHAWMADRRGDDTPRLQGRITLNPLAHIELIGTIVLPLLVVFLHASGHSGAASFIIGWGRPVQFNPGNLRRRRLDTMLIALAGPVMNVVLAAVAVGLCWVGVLTGVKMLLEVLLHVAVLSLYLCFFNLLPIPPLDGSHVARSLIGFSEELYWQMARWGFFAVILVMQLRPVQAFLGWLTFGTFRLLVKMFGLPFG
jgi:Zn-dependent protease